LGDGKKSNIIWSGLLVKGSLNEASDAEAERMFEIFDA
jgi:hypothetical protein